MRALLDTIQASLIAALSTLDEVAPLLVGQSPPAVDDACRAAEQAHLRASAAFTALEQLPARMRLYVGARFSP